MTGERVWVFGDYSQAEARIVAWRGPVPLMRHWFETGQDVHLNACKMIARVVQTNRLQLPQRLFSTKHWEDYVKTDPERDTSKQTVHASNYGVGKRKYGLLTGLPEKYAAVLQDIYFGLFPEIRTGYQAWIDSCLRRDRTVTTPQGWPIKFYDVFGPELQRSAYSLYPQSTVGLLITSTLVGVANHFGETQGGGCWRKATPTAIRARGLDTRLQIHDALGISSINDPFVINYTCSVMRHYAQQSLMIGDSELVIPMDFKVGPSWGEAVDYKPQFVEIDGTISRELDRRIPSLH
jgi:hypothetical protein